MTSIVAVLCTDGVVVGADGSATFGTPQLLTIEQPYLDKIQIVAGRYIIAGTGQVGLAQRFHAVVTAAVEQGKLNGKSYLEVAKHLSRIAIEDFQQTLLQKLEFSALVAYPVGDYPWLCEFLAGSGFQPEMKSKNSLWFTSAGSGQHITDPFLALFRSIFWKSGPPDLRGGIFTTLWALIHACEVNPGGIKEPIKIAVLEKKEGHFAARMLSDEELAEHRNMVNASTEHFGAFADVLTGKVGGEAPPSPRAA